jgi:polyphosphate glucokinase
MDVLGIDIGGTGIKGAVVDVEKGELKTERLRLPTPQPSTPEAVTRIVAEIVEHFGWKGLVGCGFPAVVRQGVIAIVANVSKEWIGVNAVHEFSKATGCVVGLGNDADVAGLAEMRFGVGRERSGVVLVLTLGTGIGSALFVDGKLVPNTEFGHIELNGRSAEKWAAYSVRERKELSWKKWGQRVEDYLKRMQFYLWPELIIIGGGVSKKHGKFLPLLNVDTEVVAAQLRNEAGIVGAAIKAAEDFKA